MGKIKKIEISKCGKWKDEIEKSENGGEIEQIGRHMANWEMGNREIEEIKK